MIDESGQSSGFGIMTQTPDTITAIKKALEAAEQFIVNGVDLGYIRMPDPETPDSAHQTLPMIRQALSTLESLQRENEDLREDRDRTARNRDMYKGQVERQADSLAWYRSGSFAHAVNEKLSSAGISISGDILHDCIQRTALSSTGDTHGN